MPRRAVATALRHAQPARPELARRGQNRMTLERLIRLPWLRADSAGSLGEAKLRLVLNTLPASIAHVNSEERYTYSNRVHASRYGRTTDEIIGCTVREILG